ncbi:hypothetical protein GEV33_008045 [Tenebrio molitor]|uniref:Uncharacterized protein n=1 Tax=Tenebrio molitor TaxID=7067 RepID=A0A8J6LBT2_TENMO|nr:hypothetical protein GEV33_008045 [Tenebrio molitor]
MVQNKVQELQIKELEFKLKTKELEDKLPSATVELLHPPSLFISVTFPPVLARIVAELRLKEDGTGIFHDLLPVVLSVPGESQGDSDRVNLQGRRDDVVEFTRAVGDDSSKYHRPHRQADHGLHYGRFQTERFCGSGSRRVLSVQVVPGLTGRCRIYPPASPEQCPSGFYIHERLSIRERPRQELYIALTDHFFARGSLPVRTEEKNLNINFFFLRKKDLEDLSAYAGGVAE